MSIWGDHKDIRKAATELQHNKKVTQQRLVSQRLHVPELLVSVMVSVLRCWRFLVPCEVSRSCGNSAPLKAAHSFMDVDISIPSLDQIRYFAILVFPNVGEFNRKQFGARIKLPFKLLVSYTIRVYKCFWLSCDCTFNMQSLQQFFLCYSGVGSLLIYSTTDILQHAYLPILLACDSDQ